MLEETIKKKLNGQFFFLVGPDFSSSEESSTVKYSECALMVHSLRAWFGHPCIIWETIGKIKWSSASHDILHKPMLFGVACLLYTTNPSECRVSLEWALCLLSISLLKVCPFWRVVPLQLFLHSAGKTCHQGLCRLNPRCLTLQLQIYFLSNKIINSCSFRHRTPFRPKSKSSIETCHPRDWWCTMLIHRTACSAKTRMEGTKGLSRKWLDCA